MPEEALKYLDVIRVQDYQFDETGKALMLAEKKFGNTMVFWPKGFQNASSDKAFGTLAHEIGHAIALEKFNGFNPPAKYIEKMNEHGPVNTAPHFRSTSEDSAEFVRLYIQT